MYVTHFLACLKRGLKTCSDRVPVVVGVYKQDFVSMYLVLVQKLEQYLNMGQVFFVYIRFSRCLASRADDMPDISRLYLVLFLHKCQNNISETKQIYGRRRRAHRSVQAAEQERH